MQQPLGTGTKNVLKWNCALLYQVFYLQRYCCSESKPILYLDTVYCNTYMHSMKRLNAVSGSSIKTGRENLVVIARDTHISPVDTCVINKCAVNTVGMHTIIASTFEPILSRQSVS